MCIDYGRKTIYAGAYFCKGRTGTQSQEYRYQASAWQAGRADRAVRFGQVVAGVRHHLRGGAAALCRVAVELRADVPWADGKAGRGLYRGTVPGDFHRPENDLQEPALDRGYGHRNLWLPALIVGAGGHAALPEVRQGNPPADDWPDYWPADGAARGHEAANLSAGGAAAQGRACEGLCGRAQVGLCPGTRGRDYLWPWGRNQAGKEQEALDWDCGRPRSRARGRAQPPCRLGGNGKRAFRRAGAGGYRRRGNAVVFPELRVRGLRDFNWRADPAHVLV